MAFQPWVAVVQNLCESCFIQPPGRMQAQQWYYGPLLECLSKNYPKRWVLTTLQNIKEREVTNWDYMPLSRAWWLGKDDTLCALHRVKVTQRGHPPSQIIKAQLTGIHNPLDWVRAGYQ